MKLRRLTDAAYQRLSHKRDQVLTKNRGYGVVSIEVNGLTFAVPLRSNMNKNSHGLKTILVNKQWNGIDYSKALIVNDEDLSKEAFKPRSLSENETRLRKIWIWLFYALFPVK
jgi:protein AbiQ